MATLIENLEAEQLNSTNIVALLTPIFPRAKFKQNEWGNLEIDHGPIKSYIRINPDNKSIEIDSEIKNKYGAMWIGIIPLTVYHILKAINFISPSSSTRTFCFIGGLVLTIIPGFLRRREYDAVSYTIEQKIVDAIEEEAGVPEDWKL